jgi:hypothetical protein
MLSLIMNGVSAWRVREGFCVRQDWEPWLYSREYGATSDRMRNLWMSG